MKKNQKGRISLSGRHIFLQESTHTVIQIQRSGLKSDDRVISAGRCLDVDLVEIVITDGCGVGFAVMHALTPLANGNAPRRTVVTQIDDIICGEPAFRGDILRVAGQLRDENRVRSAAH